MNLDQQIREALMRHETDVREAPAAFDGVERKIRRAHQRRVAATGTFVIALVVAAAVTVIALRGDQEQGFVTPGGDGSPTPGSTAAPAAIPDPVIFWDHAPGYAMLMPEIWSVTEFEGNIELLPPAQSGLAVGEDTFALEIQLRIGESRVDIDMRPGTTTSEQEVRVGQRPARRTDYENAAGSRGVYWLVDWPSSYCRPAGCTSDPNTLLIHAVSSTPDRWASYGDIALATVETLMPAVEPSDVPAGHRRTRRGDVFGEVTVDDRVMTLVRFLEDRVHGGGAEAYLAEGAPYPEGDLYGIEGEPYFRHRVMSCQVSEASTTCVVVLEFYTAREAARDEPHPSSAVENIVIGEPDGKGPKILRVERQEISEGDGP